MVCLSRRVATSLNVRSDAKYCETCDWLAVSFSNSTSSPALNSPCSDNAHSNDSRSGCAMHFNRYVAFFTAIGQFVASGYAP